MLYPLSYGRNLSSRFWSGQQDSNLRPSAPKADALPDCAMPRAIRTPRILCAGTRPCRERRSRRCAVPHALSGPERPCENPRPFRPRVPRGRQDPRRQSRRTADSRRAHHPRRTRARTPRPRRPRSRSCSSATTPRRKSTCATSSRRPRKPAWASSTSACPRTATLAATLAVVRRFNEDATVDGILVQSPLPKSMGADAEQQVFDAIDPEQGRRRLQPDLGRPPRAESRRLRAVHAGRRHRAARAQQDSDRGQARRRDRPLRHRRQADGVAAAAQERDGHDLPLAHARSARDGAHGRHPRRGDRPPRVRDARVREARRRRDRRRHQQRDLRQTKRGAFSRPAPSASRRSSGAAPCSSATSTRTWRTSRARSRRCPAASARSRSRC